MCYWPNLGHGRFGAKVVMDNAPHFDRPEVFSATRVRFADIDGSGTSDIIYLTPDQVHLYMNQAGNRLSDRHTVTSLPPVDSLSNFSVADLLGHGTSCLLLSSPTPVNRDTPVVYVDLMGGRKPHLLERVINNLGMETLYTWSSGWSTTTA